MYLTIHLVLFTGAFVLFAWQLCTWRISGWKHRLSRRQFSPLISATRLSRGVNVNEFHQAIERPKSDVAVLRRRPDSGLGDDYRPVNRIRRYLR
jgi:hypothetical protein